MPVCWVRELTLPGIDPLTPPRSRPGTAMLHSLADSKQQLKTGAAVKTLPCCCEQGWALWRTLPLRLRCAGGWVRHDP